jgi:hypothetical protein
MDQYKHCYVDKMEERMKEETALNQAILANLNKLILPGEK